VSKLAKVKPVIIVDLATGRKEMSMTIERYRADQRLIRAVKKWMNGIGDYSYLLDEVYAHSKATGGK
jgi:hypothetical protein